MVEPRTVVLEYPARWKKPRIDLDELAKLRRAGWRTKQLSARFGVGISTVKMAYAKLRKQPRTESCKEKEAVEALRDFEMLSPSEQETFLSKAARTNSSAGLSPPPIVLRKLAALAWIRSRL